MKKLLILAAVSEAATGIALIAVPTIVVRFLCGAELIGVGIVIARIYGISLIAIGVACWPSDGAGQAFYGMLTYSTLATLYMTAIGIGGYSGILLWPATLFHAFLTVALVGAWLKQRKTRVT